MKKVVLSPSGKHISIKDEFFKRNPDFPGDVFDGRVVACVNCCGLIEVVVRATKKTFTTVNPTRMDLYRESFDPTSEWTIEGAMRGVEERVDWFLCDNFELAWRKYQRGELKAGCETHDCKLITMDSGEEIVVDNNMPKGIYAFRFKGRLSVITKVEDKKYLRAELVGKGNWQYPDKSLKEACLRALKDHASHPNTNSELFWFEDEEDFLTNAHKIK